MFRVLEFWHHGRKSSSFALFVYSNMGSISSSLKMKRFNEVRKTWKIMALAIVGWKTLKIFFDFNWGSEYLQNILVAVVSVFGDLASKWFGVAFFEFVILFTSIKFNFMWIINNGHWLKSFVGRKDSDNNSSTTLFQWIHTYDIYHKISSTSVLIFYEMNGISSKSNSFHRRTFPESIKILKSWFKLRWNIYFESMD